MKYGGVSYHPEASSSPTLLCPPHLKACAQVLRKPSALRDKLIEVKGNPIHFGHASRTPPTPGAHPWMDTNGVSQFLILSYKGRSESHWPANGRSSQQLPAAGFPHADFCPPPPPPLRSSQTLIAAFND